VRRNCRPRKGFAPLLLASLTACSAGSPTNADDTPDLRLGQARQRYVNGEDDRREYFELDDDELRYGVERFAVALTSSRVSTLLARGEAGRIETWGELDGLCSGEPFADQPAAVFCSGVLVDWDLVLTSGHCVDVLPVSSLRVVFDYYYRAPGELAVSDSSIYAVREVIKSESDGAATSARLDYAWLRLSEVVRAPYHPAAVYTNGPAVEVTDPIINISAGGGVPLKVDAGGHIQDTRASVLDYFVADTDTSQGSSGSGAFDGDLALVGTLARGAPDFVETEAGCFTTDVGLDPSEAIEEYTYAHRAVKALCEAGSDSVLCNPDCEQPCDAAGTPPRARDDGGCAFRGAASGERNALGAGLLFTALVLLVRRRQLF